MSFNTTPSLPVQKSELDQLLAHLFKSPEFFQLALPKLQAGDFDSQLERPHKLLWAIMSQYHKTYGKALKAEHFLAEIDRYTFNSREFAGQSVLDAVYALAGYMVSYPASAINVSAAASGLERLLFQRRIRSDFLMLAEANLITPENLIALHKQSLDTKVAHSPTTEPFADDGMFGLKPRCGIGILFLDSLLNGGTRSGEVYGCLAPSGGGKTTLANQIGISYARQKRHFVVFSYEQPTDNEYMVPVYACATGISRDRIGAVNKLQELTDAEQAKFQAAKLDLVNYLHYMDMSGTHSTAGNGGVEEIEAALIRFRDAGMPVSGFAIDWFWPMMQRRYSHEPQRKDQNERTYAIKMVDDLRQACGRNECWCWVNHQSAPATVSKTRKAAWTDAAEAKGWSWYLTGCFALNDINEENCQATLNFSKARNTRKNHKIVKLLGEIATFIDVGATVSYNPRTRSYENKDRPGAVPEAGQVRL